MAKNNDGLEAGAPVAFEDIARLEREKRRAKIDQAAEPVVKPKPAPKKRKTSASKEGNE